MLVFLTLLIMSRDLPSLRALLVFEMAAREDSFTKAAQRLCITHSAVSHQIRALEDWFRKPLFNRHADGITLTPAGKTLAKICASSFANLEAACSRVRDEIETPALTITCSASFMARWLIPRLERFESRFPDTLLRLQTHGALDELRRGKIDAIICSGQSMGFADIESTKLADDVIGPVCHPALAARLQFPQDLEDVPRLHAASRPGAWMEWARLTGTCSDLAIGRVLDSLSLTIDAAKSGLGIAIAPKLLAQADIDNGYLVAPFGFVHGEHSFYLCISHEPSPPSHLLEFQRWVMEESNTSDLSKTGNDVGASKSVGSR